MHHLHHRQAKSARPFQITGRLGAILCLVVSVSAATAGPPALDASNVARPLPGITTSGQISEQDLELLASEGYVGIVNLRGPDERGNFDATAGASRRQIAYHTLPIASAEDVTLEAAKELDRILDQLAPSDERPVLVHCASSNRVGALLALRAHADGASVDDALELGRAAGLRSLESRVRELIE